MGRNRKKRAFIRDNDSSKVEEFSEGFVNFLEKEYGLKDAKGFSDKFLRFLDEEYGIKEEFEKIVSKAKKEIEIPISAFNNDELSILECVCRYLKEGLGLRYCEIASLLNRDERTIWVVYNNSLKKRKKKLVFRKSKILIPVSKLEDRKFTVFEGITLHLKDHYNLNYRKIGELLRRDERNIWAIYQRARKKNVK